MGFNSSYSEPLVITVVAIRMPQMGFSDLADPLECLMPLFHREIGEEAVSELFQPHEDSSSPPTSLVGRSK